MAETQLDASKLNIGILTARVDEPKDQGECGFLPPKKPELDLVAWSSLIAEGY